MILNILDSKKDSQVSIPKSEIIIDKEHNIKYRRGKKLGMGGFGEVYEFIIIETNEKRAAKIISNSKIDDPQSQSSYFYEKKFNELLGFKYLCKCYNIFNDEQNTYFILDYMKNKTLNELNEKRRLTELEIKHYCFELLLAIEYLHKMNIIHRDIKLSNVLLNENMEVRLCDFGLAIDNGVKEQKNICGTLNYIAPELYNKKGGLKYSFKTDIWAFGVLMYSLFFKKTPFKKEPKKKTDYNTQNIDVSFPKDVYISKEAKDLLKEAKDLLKKILVKDPDNRPKIETIKASSFFRNGKGIPKYLPESTMIKPMNRDEEEKFVNDAIFKGECLDKDCDLPDKVANKRSYTERNEMESNFDQDDSSSKTDEEDENKSNESSNSNDDKNYIIRTNVNNYNKERKENDNNNIVVKIEKNNKRNSLSFSNIIVEKNASREETNKNIKVLNGTNEKINEHQDSSQNTPNFKFKGEEDSENQDKNILSPDFEKKINKKFIDKLDLNNNKATNSIDEKEEIEINEIEIKKQNNKEKYENDKNDYNEDHNIKKVLKEKVKNNNNIIIKKFIDLSDKCGMGYLLTNDDIGIYFNDNTKIVKIKNTNNFVYINEQGEQTTYHLKKSKLDYDLKTKVNALILFYREFNKISLNKKGCDKNQKIHKENPDLFVKKWIKSQYAYFFLLSNDKVQIIFEDKSQIIFDFFQKKICFINKMKENSIYNIENTRFENESIEQKVKYVKRILKKIS